MFEREEKSYRIKSVSGNIDWDKIDNANIDVYCWRYDYKPTAFAKAVLHDECELVVKMTVYEKNPKADYKKYGEDVYKDSCLEFFASFSGDDYYMNCEMNAAGASLISFGRFDCERTDIDKILGHVPEINAEVSEDKWSVEVHFSLDDIEKISGVRLRHGSKFTGNFFKCGDETEFEHYGMWCRSIAVIPQFHRPAYFGDLIID